MQRRTLIKQTLKEQGISYKTRKLILYAFEKQYDGLLQYSDMYGKTRCVNHLHYQEELKPALRKLGYELIDEEGIQFMVKI